MSTTAAITTFPLSVPTQGNDVTIETSGLLLENLPFGISTEVMIGLIENVIPCKYIALFMLFI
jgi:hypothetical protein